MYERVIASFSVIGGGCPKTNQNNVKLFNKNNKVFTVICIDTFLSQTPPKPKVMDTPMFAVHTICTRVTSEHEHLTLFRSKV